MDQDGLALALRVETAALHGACASQERDKSDFIRIWAIARRARGQDAGADAWRHEYHRYQEAEAGVRAGEGEG